MVECGLLGASSLVGECVIPLLIQDGRHIVAFSRFAHDRRAEPEITWSQLGVSPSAFPDAHLIIREWLCVAPIWVLPQYFEMIEAYGAHRVVALSSTSLFIKEDSSDNSERHVAHRLAEGERALRVWAEAQGIEWVILRPTLIYGRGKDKNLAEIIRFVRRWGFFPLLGRADGLRRPVHAEDVAAACLSAMTRPAAANRTYNISGGETLPYREMVGRIFGAIGKSLQLVTIPRWLFRLAVIIAHLLPRYRYWTMEMAERMNRDLVFDHTDAARDLDFSPRPFQLLPRDIPA